MNIDRYAKLVKERLYPEPYTDCVASLPSEFQLLLTCKSRALARYAICVTRWDDSLNGAAFLKTRRRAAARKLRAAWWLSRSVGLYLVVCGSCAEWQEHVSEMPADKTGLHSVIVQAVHFVDPETGDTALNQSAWGPVRFGGVDSVASIVNSITITST